MMKRKKFLIMASLVLGSMAIYILFWPIPCNPVYWVPPLAPSMEKGIYQTNDLLKNVERMASGTLEGVETVAMDPQGRIYGGTSHGEIVRLDPSTQKLEKWVHTGGRPLGLSFDKFGNLIVADANSGLLSITPQGKISVLSKECHGRPFGLVDDVDVAKDGMIYFSDASDKFSLANYQMDIFEHGANGRLLSYDPTTKKTSLLLDGLNFANGVAVSPDGSFVLVAETSSYRILRYWLAGSQKGKAEVFIDNLPGFPDGISSNGKGTYWLAIFAPRNPVLDFILPRVFLRKMVIRLPDFLKPKPLRYSFILGLSGDGKVIRNLQDPEGRSFAPITNVEEFGGMLYLGGLHETAIGRIPST